MSYKEIHKKNHDQTKTSCKYPRILGGSISGICDTQSRVRQMEYLDFIRVGIPFICGVGVAWYSQRRKTMKKETEEEKKTKQVRS